MKYRFVIAALVTFIATQGWAQPVSQVTDADRQAITQVKQQEVARVIGGNIDNLLAVYSDDVVLMPPGQTAVVGKAALRTWLENLYRQYRVEVLTSSATSGLAVNGNLAFERWDYTLSLAPTAGGAAVNDVGKGIHVYRRQADGSWKIALDIWNSDKPAP